MRVNIRQGVIPSQGIAIKLEEDLLAEKGQFLVVDPDNEIYAVMTEADVNLLYTNGGGAHKEPEREPGRTKRRYKRYDHWTDFDTEIMKRLQTATRYETKLKVPELRQILGLANQERGYQKVAARLRYMVRHGWAEKVGEGRTKAAYRATPEGMKIDLDQIEHKDDGTWHLGRLS